MAAFHVVRTLRQGEIADVLVAEAPPGGAQVIVKRLRAELRHDKDALDLFAREIMIARQLHHPNIVAVQGVGDDDGLPYFVMEHLDGLSLHELFTAILAKRRKLHPGVACGIAANVARALSFAHSLTIVHRDVSPDNIVLTRTGEVKLIDFGIARSSRDAKMTTSGLVRGKAGYMAPEQVAGLEVGPPADLFALGVVLWEMLVGRHPFPATSIAEGVRAIREEPAQPPSVKAPRVPPGVDAIVLGLLSKFPSSRPPRAIDVATFLDQAAEGLGVRDLAKEISALLP